MKLTGALTDGTPFEASVVIKIIRKGKVKKLMLSNDASLPQEYSIFQNYPNPFNPQTTFTYDLPKSSPVILEIYNLIGHRVRTLVNSWVNAGHHSVVWDGRDDSGRQVAGGIYFYRIQAGEFKQTMRLLVLK